MSDDRLRPDAKPFEFPGPDPRTPAEIEANRREMARHFAHFEAERAQRQTATISPPPATTWQIKTHRIESPMAFSEETIARERSQLGEWKAVRSNPIQPPKDEVP